MKFKLRKAESDIRIEESDISVERKGKKKGGINPWTQPR